MSVTELLPQIQQLSPTDKRQILEFLQVDLAAGDDHLEQLSDQIADEFQACFDGAIPKIPDRAFIRAGIYEGRNGF
jgi:hypothetical protein